MGCPTGAQFLPSAPFSSITSAIANLPDESIAPMSSVTQTGVYFGYAQVIREKGDQVELSEEEGKVYPMVMSLGWNPFYKNKQLTAVSQT